jgi:hypothetical protein
VKCNFTSNSNGEYLCVACGEVVRYSGTMKLNKICRVRSTCFAGTELEMLLGRFGINASGDCKCRSRSALMNSSGCDWCEANIQEIVGWLRESAGERGLPFLDAAGRLLVRRAIANARREEARRKAASA